MKKRWKKWEELGGIRFSAVYWSERENESDHDESGCEMLKSRRTWNEDGIKMKKQKKKPNWESNRFM